MSQESLTFAQPNSILDDVYTSQNEILDGWYVKEKWTRVGTEDDFSNVCFFIVTNISPCHRNPRLLPILVPYWVMSRHPKKKS